MLIKVIYVGSLLGLETSILDKNEARRFPSSTNPVYITRQRVISFHLFNMKYSTLAFKTRMQSSKTHRYATVYIVLSNF